VVLTRRENPFKHCYKWKDQQAAVWARVKEVTKKGKQKWRVGDLLADERCSPAVADFLRSTHVGRAAPPVEGNWDEAEEAGADEAVDGGGASGVVTRGLLVSGFICNLLGALSVRIICRSRGRGCYRARPSGRDGRSDQDKL